MNLRQDIDKHIFRTVGQAADDMEMDAYVIGGYVRDIFLDRTSSDIDFVAVGSGIDLAYEVARRLGRGAKLSIFKTYGTAQVKYRGFELEFVGARRESYSRFSRNPIVEDGTLEDDQARRDFTINILALGLNHFNFGDLIDPFNGLIDLHNKILRTPCDPDMTFSDDPLRMMRAIRFASQLGFSIDPETFEAIKRNRLRIEIITKERINSELSKIMRSPKPSVGLTLLDQAGLLEIIFPELVALKGVETIEGRGHKDNFAHTLQVVDNVAAVSDFEWLRWAALMHDIAKPVTKQYSRETGWTFRNHNFIGEKMVERIFRKMKLPLNAKMKYVAKLVGLHMRPQQIGEEGVTDSAVRRMIADAADPDDLADLMLLAEADLTSKNPVKVRRVLQTFSKVRLRLAQIKRMDAKRAQPAIINGNEIMEAFGVEPSSMLGEIKDTINKKVEEEHLDYSDAFDYMLEIAPGYGLTPVEDVASLRERFEARNAERSQHRLQMQQRLADEKYHRDVELGRIDPSKRNYNLPHAENNDSTQQG